MFFFVMVYLFINPFVLRVNFCSFFAQASLWNLGMEKNIPRLISYPSYLWWHHVASDVDSFPPFERLSLSLFFSPKLRFLTWTFSFFLIYCPCLCATWSLSIQCRIFSFVSMSHGQRYTNSHANTANTDGYKNKKRWSIFLLLLTQCNMVYYDVALFY